MAAILADDNFECVFFYENDRIPIRISLKFVPRRPIDNMPALLQIMACRLDGGKPLSAPMLAYCQWDAWEQISVKFGSEYYHFHRSKPMLTQFTDAYMRH